MEGLLTETLVTLVLLTIVDKKRIQLLKKYSLITVNKLLKLRLLLGETSLDLAQRLGVTKVEI